VRGQALIVPTETGAVEETVLSPFNGLLLGGVIVGHDNTMGTLNVSSNGNIATTQLLIGAAPSLGQGNVNVTGGSADIAWSGFEEFDISTALQFCYICR